MIDIVSSRDLRDPDTCPWCNDEIVELELQEPAAHGHVHEHIFRCDNCGYSMSAETRDGLDDSLLTIWNTRKGVVSLTKVKQLISVVGHKAADYSISAEALLNQGRGDRHKAMSGVWTEIGTLLRVLLPEGSDEDTMLESPTHDTHKANIKAGWRAVEACFSGGKVGMDGALKQLGNALADAGYIGSGT